MSDKIEPNGGYDALYGRPIFYDDPEGAERLAEELGVPVKHAGMKKHKHYSSISVVVTPSDLDHRTHRG